MHPSTPRLLLVLSLVSLVHITSAERTTPMPLAIDSVEGGAWLSDLAFGFVTADGTSVLSTDERFGHARDGSGAWFRAQATDQRGEVDLALSVTRLGPRSAEAQLTVHNRGKEAIALERVIVLSGRIAAPDGFGQVLPDCGYSNMWAGGALLRAPIVPLHPGQTYEKSAWTVAVERPALAAGFLTAKRNFDRFTLTAEEGALRVVAWGECDGCLLPAGATRESDLVFLSAEGNPLAEMERFADRAAEINGAKLRFDNFATWCSWYSGWVRQEMHGFKGGLEQGMLDQAPLVAREFAGRLATTMRAVDDSDEAPYGDFDDKTFAVPNGFASLAKKLRAEGITPGVWYTPYWVSNKTKMFKEHPDWLGKTKDGEVYIENNLYGNTSGVFDSSNPEVCDVMERQARAWVERGYDYIMTDFLLWGTRTPRWHDPTMTKIEAYHAGLVAMRRGFGDRYWLNCGAITAPAMGLADGMRISDDNWGGGSAYIYSGLRWYFHRRLWLNDPDATVMRMHESPWNRGWGSFRALAGLVETYGDTFDDLAPEHLDTYKRLYPPMNNAGRPLDLWENQPNLVWGTMVGAVNLFGLFHFDEAYDSTVRLNLDEISARTKSFTEKPRTAPAHWLVWDFWNERLHESDGAVLALPVPSRTGQVFALRAAAGRPQLLGTRGHWSMDALEVPECNWSAEKKTLSGRARGNAGDPTALFVHVPEGWKLQGANVDGKATKAVVEKAVARIDIPTAEEPLPFAVTFTSTSVAKEKERPFAAGPAAKVTWSGPRLTALLQRGGLAAYADCGGRFQYQLPGGPQLVHRRGGDYAFQQQDAPAWFCTVFYDARAVRYDVVGLDASKRYELGWSWWDHNGDGRVESVTVSSLDGEDTKVLVEKAALPAWAGKRQPAAERTVELPRGLYGNGQLRISWSNEADVPNAVVSEVWLREL